jgi:hypothetical protein
MNLYESVKRNLKEDEEVAGEVEKDNFADLENLYKKVVATARVLWDKLTVLEGIDCSALLQYNKLPRNTRRAIAQKVRLQITRVNIGSPVDDYILLNYLESDDKPEWSIGYDLEGGKSTPVALMSVSHGSRGYLASKKGISVRSEDFNRDVENGDYDDLVSSNIDEVKNRLEQALELINSLLDTTDEFEDEYFYRPRSFGRTQGFGRYYVHTFSNGNTSIEDDTYFYNDLDDYAKGDTYSIDRMSDDEILKMYNTLVKAIDSNILRDYNMRLDPNDEEYNNLKHYLPIMEQILKDRKINANK